MLKFFLLGSIFLIELVYVCARRYGTGKLAQKLRSKGQTRARWFSQLVFAHIALQLPFTLALSGFFLWARAIHLFWPSTLVRNFVWLAGLIFLLASTFTPDATDLSIYGAIGIELLLSTLGLCLCHRHSHEFDHLAWGHSAYLLFLLPAAIASDMVPMWELFDYGVTLGLFVLYLRMRMPWGMSEDSIDYSNIFEALENHRAIRLYLAKIDPGVKDIYDALDRDCVQVNKGNLKTPMPSSQYKGALEYLNIEYREHDIHGVREDLILYIHKNYDSKKVWRAIRAFFLPPWSRKQFDSARRVKNSSSGTTCRSTSSSNDAIELEESSEDKDSILDMATESYSSLSSDDNDTEIIYAEIKDFE